MWFCSWYIVLGILSCIGCVGFCFCLLDNVFLGWCCVVGFIIVGWF